MPNAQSVVIVFAEDEETSKKEFYWPHKDIVSDELHSLINFSLAQSSNSTSAVSGESYRITLPIVSSTEELLCYLGVEVNLAGGPQESVKRIVEWSGLWLGLLLQQERENVEQKELSLSHAAALTDFKEDALRVHEDTSTADSSSLDSIESSGVEFKSFLLRYKYLIAALSITLILFIPVDYRISVNAVIEGEIESPVIAPFDGYIKTAGFKAGDQVDESTLLAELDERDIYLKLKKLEGERQEKQKSYRQVLASGERSKAEVLKAKIMQLNAQIDTVTLALSQTELRSRISGIVIAGDLSRSIGAPVKKGDVLFKVAPIDKYRTMLRIKETDIRFMEQGLDAELKLTSFPSASYPIKLLKPSPYFTDENNQIIYLVEARMESGSYSELRPGMEGIAKVNVGSYSLGWGLFHHFSDWMSMQLWALKP